MNKLPISIGILAWHSGQTLVNTLTTYWNNGLLDIVYDVTILFQEVTDEDEQIAEHFSIPYIGLNENIGIGKAFTKLIQNAQTDNILLLEHDWQLIENQETTYDRLSSGLELLNNGFTYVRYRHREQPGYPHFSFKYKGNELNYYDDWHQCVAPHLLDSIHWMDPSISFPDKIKKEGEYFTTTSRWGNWTNNPYLIKKEFYLNNVSPFVGEGIDLEEKIAYWWPRQNFKVAHGEGLFKHVDLVKYAPH
jgi:hypothetical protein